MRGLTDARCRCLIWVRVFGALLPLLKEAAQHARDTAADAAYGPRNPEHIGLCDEQEKQPDDGGFSLDRWCARSGELYPAKP